MNEVCYWDSISKTLTGSIISKAKKFNKLKCVERVGKNVWLIHPIEGYNITCYTVQRTLKGWQCTCQFNAQYGRTCSHIMAAALNEKMEDYQILSTEVM